MPASGPTLTHQDLQHPAVTRTPEVGAYSNIRDDITMLFGLTTDESVKESMRNQTDAIGRVTVGHPTSKQAGEPWDFGPDDNSAADVALSNGRKAGQPKKLRCL